MAKSNTLSAGNEQGVTWIAWERQRRSLLLAAKLSAALFIIDFSRFGAFRHFFSAVATFLLLFRRRHTVIVVQNPSMILAAEAAALKKVFGYRLLIDRHSNFMLDERNHRRIRYKAFMALSRYTLQRADLTIVTNRQIALRVTHAGGAPFQLPDPLMQQPKSPPASKAPEVFHLFFPSTWARDEPVYETAVACRELGNTFRVYVTGNPRSAIVDAIGAVPENFIITGFLTDERYFAMMQQCQAVMPLTRFPEVLVCGGYEAMSSGKPLLLGDSLTLREFYPQGALFTNCNPSDIAAKIRMIRDGFSLLEREIQELYFRRLAEWNQRFSSLEQTLTTL